MAQTPQPLSSVRQAYSQQCKSSELLSSATVGTASVHAEPRQVQFFAVIPVEMHAAVGDVINVVGIAFRNAAAVTARQHQATQQHRHSQQRSHGKPFRGNLVSVLSIMTSCAVMTTHSSHKSDIDSLPDVAEIYISPVRSPLSESQDQVLHPVCSIDSDHRHCRTTERISSENRQDSLVESFASARPGAQHLLFHQDPV